MSWQPRLPGSNEPKGTRTRLTEGELESLGLKAEPGSKCPSCGFSLDHHSDLDCILALSSAVKKLLADLATAQESLDELGDLYRVARNYTNSSPVERGQRYQDLVACVNYLQSIVPDE